MSLYNVQKNCTFTGLLLVSCWVFRAHPSFPFVFGSVISETRWSKHDKNDILNGKSEHHSQMKSLYGGHYQFFEQDLTVMIPLIYLFNHQSSKSCALLFSILFSGLLHFQYFNKNHQFQCFLPEWPIVQHLPGYLKSQFKLYQAACGARSQYPINLDWSRFCQCKLLVVVWPQLATKNHAVALSLLPPLQWDGEEKEKLVG